MNGEHLQRVVPVAARVVLLGRRRDDGVPQQVGDDALVDRGSHGVGVGVGSGGVRERDVGRGGGHGRSVEQVVTRW